MRRDLVRPAKRGGKGGRGGKDEGTRRLVSFRKATRQIMRRKPAKPMPPPQTQQPPPTAYAAPLLYLADTLDWLNLWQDNGAGLTDDHAPAVDYSGLRL